MSVTVARHIGVRDEYAPKFGRQCLTLWSGVFLSDFEGTATELPGHDGFMISTEYHGDVRVSCPSPRTDKNYLQVDEALEAAVRELLAAGR
jgi:hypothetical protein